MSRKKPLEKTFLDFKNWVKNIQTAGYNGAHTVTNLSTKMGADKLAENTPNAPKFIGPNCLPKPKSLGFR